MKNIILFLSSIVIITTLPSCQNEDYTPYNTTDEKIEEIVSAYLIPVLRSLTKSEFKADNNYPCDYYDSVAYSESQILEIIEYDRNGIFEYEAPLCNGSQNAHNTVNLMDGESDIGEISLFGSWQTETEYQKTTELNDFTIIGKFSGISYIGNAVQNARKTYLVLGLSHYQKINDKFMKGLGEITLELDGDSPTPETYLAKITVSNGKMYLNINNGLELKYDLEEIYE